MDKTASAVQAAIARMNENAWTLSNLECRYAVRAVDFCSGACEMVEAVWQDGPWTTN